MKMMSVICDVPNFCLEKGSSTSIFSDREAFQGAQPVRTEVMLGSGRSSSAQPKTETRFNVW